MNSKCASYERPAFWKFPAQPQQHNELYNRSNNNEARQKIFHIPITIDKGYVTQNRRDSIKKRVHFADESQSTQVQLGSPAYGEVLRGDVISKIGEYDARDLSHSDAQHLFRNAGNEINIVVHRDNKIAYTQGLSNESSRCNSAIPPANSPELLNAQHSLPHRAPSPFLAGPGHYERALEMPVDTLPHTVFPKLNQSGGYVAPPEGVRSFSPMPTRDHLQDVAEEQSSIVNQPYRTTPLVLPGAKVKKDAPSTDSYLRHYPNPAVRAHPHQHDYQDSIMKQRVADTMLHKVVGQEADTGKVFHKQFNSPIGLYSESNIENTIRQTVPSANTYEPRLRKSPLQRALPTKLDGYKKTLVYDPSKSETYRAIQEEGYGYGESPQEVAQPVQPRVFQPQQQRLVPGKRPIQSAPDSGASYNVVNTHDETIRQSGSFNRLMYSVLGASDY